MQTYKAARLVCLAVDIDKSVELAVWDKRTLPGTPATGVVEITIHCR